MRAAILYGPRDIRIEEIDDPKVEQGEVLVEVKAAGICGSDLHFHRSIAPGVESAKRVLGGHELSGEVVATSDDVTRVKVGDRVGVEPLLGCRECRLCQIGQYHLCKKLKHIGGAYPGGFGEYAKAPEDKVFKLPENVSCGEAALLDCFAVSVHAIQRVNVEITDTVVVLGDGPMGLTTLQLVKASGAARTVITGHHDRSLQIAERTGADATVNEIESDAVDKVLRLTDGGADIVFETVGGTANTLEQASQMITPGGAICTIGIFTEKPDLDYRSLLRKEVSLVFAWSYAKWGVTPELKISLDMVASEKLDAKSLITHRFPLDEINSAFAAALDKGRSGAVKVLVIP